MNDVEISLTSTNNCERLRHCLDTIPAACRGLQWHVTVIDNASEDETAAMVRARYPWAMLLQRTSRQGFAANHNIVIAAAVEQAETRYVLVIHEDIEFEPDAVTSLVRFADAHPEAGIVGPLIVGPAGERHSSLRPFPKPASSVISSFHPLFLVRRPRRTAWLDGPCTLLRADLARRIGPLDERFFIFYEDVDFGRRAADAGYHSLLCAEAKVVHVRHGTVGQSEFGTAMELQLQRSRFLYMRKHHGLAGALLVSYVDRFTFGLRAAWAAVRRRRRLTVLLIRLAVYNPWTPLPHELASR